MVGKTASVLHVIHQLKIESSRNGSLPSFDFVNINGMTVSHPSDVYILLWKAISSQKLNHDNAFHNLDNFFADRQNITQQRKHNDKACKTIVLLLDEIDYLMTSKQEVLYNLFEWPVRTQRSSDSDAVVNGNRLIVIGISNTINLPQLLTTRVRSRLGGDKCLFSAYKQEEISIILQQHLSSIDDDESHDDRTNINDKKNVSMHVFILKLSSLFNNNFFCSLSSRCNKICIEKSSKHVRRFKKCLSTLPFCCRDDPL